VGRKRPWLWPQAGLLVALPPQPEGVWGPAGGPLRGVQPPAPREPQQSQVSPSPPPWLPQSPVGTEKPWLWVVPCLCVLRNISENAALTPWSYLFILDIKINTSLDPLKPHCLAFNPTPATTWPWIDNSVSLPGKCRS
jgi:hypothetical protein